MFTLKMISVGTLNMGEIFMDLALFHLRQRSLKYFFFNYIKGAGGRNNDNQLCLSPAEPAARRK